MKTQIERLFDKYRQAMHKDIDIVYGSSSLERDILALIPNNDWLEYPEHKPSGKGCYNVQLKMNGFVRTDEWQGTTDEWARYTNDEIIVFKPIPIEPFKPKNKYVELINKLQDKVQECDYDTYLELKTKIENGDLKWKKTKKHI